MPELMRTVRCDIFTEYVSRHLQAMIEANKARVLRELNRISKPVRLRYSVADYSKTKAINPKKRFEILYCFDLMMNLGEAIQYLRQFVQFCHKYQIRISRVNVANEIEYQGQTISNLRRNKALIEFIPKHKS